MSTSSPRLSLSCYNCLDKNGYGNSDAGQGGYICATLTCKGSLRNAQALVN